MLLAALSLMHEQTHQAGNAKRCQLVEAAITHFVKRFRPVLLDNSQQDDAAPTATSEQPAAWQQVRHTVSKYTCPVWAAQYNTWLFIKLTPKGVSLPPAPSPHALVLAVKGKSGRKRLSCMSYTAYIQQAISLAHLMAQPQSAYTRLSVPKAPSRTQSLQTTSLHSSEHYSRDTMQNCNFGRESQFVSCSLGSCECADARYGAAAVCGAGGTAGVQVHAA